MRKSDRWELEEWDTWVKDASCMEKQWRELCFTLKDAEWRKDFKQRGGAPGANRGWRMRGRESREGGTKWVRRRWRQEAGGEREGWQREKRRMSAKEKRWGAQQQGDERRVNNEERGEMWRSRWKQRQRDQTKIQLNNTCQVTQAHVQCYNVFST